MKQICLRILIFFLIVATFTGPIILAFDSALSSLPLTSFELDLQNTVEAKAGLQLPALIDSQMFGVELASGVYDITTNCFYKHPIHLFTKYLQVPLNDPVFAMVQNQTGDNNILYVVNCVNSADYDSFQWTFEGIFTLSISMGILGVVLMVILMTLTWTCKRGKKTDQLATAEEKEAILIVQKEKMYVPEQIAPQFQNRVFQQYQNAQNQMNRQIQQQFLQQQNGGAVVVPSFPSMV